MSVKHYSGVHLTFYFASLFVYILCLLRTPQHTAHEACDHGDGQTLRSGPYRERRTCRVLFRFTYTIRWPAMAVSIEGGLNIEHTHLPTLFIFFRIHVLRCCEGPPGWVFCPLQSVRGYLYEKTYYHRCEAIFIVISSPPKGVTNHVLTMLHFKTTRMTLPITRRHVHEHEVGDGEQRMSRVLGSAARRKARCHISATQGHFRAIEKI